MASYYVLGPNGQCYGPADEATLVQWASEGRIQAATVLRTETGQTLVAGQVPALAGVFPANVPPMGFAAAPYASPGYPPQPPYVTPAPTNRIAAGICAILIGHLGVHKFILGFTGPGLILLLSTVLTCGLAGLVTWAIGLIEGIIYLTKSEEEFHQTYVVERKQWF